MAATVKMATADNVSLPSAAASTSASSSRSNNTTTRGAYHPTNPFLTAYELDDGAATSAVSSSTDAEGPDAGLNANASANGSRSSLTSTPTSRPVAGAAGILPPPQRRRPSTPTSRAPAPAQDYPEPTTIPTPGRPLLRDGKILVMPPTWEDCVNCHGTGYKHADPEHPHDACWRQYGKRYTPGLLQTANSEPCILQKPLPHYPGPTAGGSSSSATYAPPTHPPPPSRQHPHRRPSPPRVNRANDANEASEDPQGEAPPSYEDVVRVHQNVSLPPQRTGQAQGETATQRPTPPQHSPSHSQTSSTTSYRPPLRGPHDAPYHNHPPPTISGYPGAGAPPPPSHYGNFATPFQPPVHHGPGYFPSQQYVSNTLGGPPPGALVVSPGDPRIGGRICTKCGGRGMRDSMWWGTETCHHCYGAGRVI